MVSRSKHCVRHVVEHEHDHHERDSQIERESGDQVVEAGFALERRSNAGAATHGVSLSCRKDQEGKDDGYKQADDHEDLIEDVQGNLGKVEVYRLAGLRPGA